MTTSQTVTPASTPRAQASQPSTPVAQVQSAQADLATGASALLANLNLQENQAGYSPVATPRAPRRGGPSNNPFAASTFSSTGFQSNHANALRLNANTSPTQHNATQNNPPVNQQNFTLAVPAVRTRQQLNIGVAPIGQGNIANAPAILFLAAQPPIRPIGTTVQPTPMTPPQATPHPADDPLFEDVSTPQHGSASTSPASTPQNPPAYVVITPEKDKHSSK